MKTLLYLFTFLLLTACAQKSDNPSVEPKTSEAANVMSSDLVKSKIKYKSYAAEGVFLKGRIRLFDDDQKRVGTLEIDSISFVQIVYRSTVMFNAEGKSDNCDKAYFLKVKYQGRYYTVFGQDVYEIDTHKKFSTQNEKQEKLVLFPISDFGMGASDDVGLTGCDDYSLLVLVNDTKNHCSLMKSPSNEEIHVEATNKYLSLFHDDGSYEEIYKLTVKQDTLIIGIKASYQEGGSVFNVNAKLTDEFPETWISDKIHFETDEELKKMDGIK